MSEIPQPEKQQKGIFQKLLNKVRRQDGDNRSVPTEKVIVSKSGMSRREFLKRAGTVSLGAFIETQTGVLGDVFLEGLDKFFRDINLTKEGNPIQFLAILEDLLREYAKNPSQENMNLIGAWLKFNGAIHYGARANMELASQFVTHFLYGEGDLDVTEQFSYQVGKSLEELSDEKKVKIGLPENLSNEDATVFLLQNILSNEALPPFAFHPDTESGPFALDQDSEKLTYLSGQPSEEIVGKRIKIFAVAYSVNPRLMNSMGQFTAVSEGRVISVEENGIQLEDVTLQIKDKYDWSQGQEFGASTNVASLIEEMGIEQLFAHEAFDDLKSQKLEIMDWEGKLLVDRGFSHNFDIIGSYDVPGDMELKINNLLSPSEEYIQSSGAKIIQIN